MKESLKVVYFQLKRTFIPISPAALTSSCSWSFWAFVLVEAPDSPDDNKVCRCHTRPVGAGPGSSYRCHSCRKTCECEGLEIHTENSWSGVFKQQEAKPQQATQKLTSKVTASVKSMAAIDDFITGRPVCTICFWST